MTHAPIAQLPTTAAEFPDGLVADSYNDALRWVEPDTGRVTTWLRGLHEPNGVAIGRRFVYVADTNAHIVIAVDPTSLETRELSIAM